MMQVATFSKEMHDVYLRLEHRDNEHYNWVKIADGKEVVFENSITEVGLMTLYNVNGELKEVYVLREWCKNFKPLSDL